MSWLSWQEGERVAVSLQLVKTAAEWETIVHVQHLQVLNHWMFLTGSQDILQLQCVVCGKKTETKKTLARFEVVVVFVVPQPSWPKYWFLKTPDSVNIRT